MPRIPTAGTKWGKERMERRSGIPARALRHTYAPHHYLRMKVDTHEVRARYTSISGLPPPELLLRLEFGRWHIFQRRGNDIGNGENREAVTGRTTSARVDRDAGRQHNETLRAIRNAGNEQRVLVRDVTLPCASASSVQV